MLNISAEDIPLQYQAIVLRLRLAIADTHTRNLMQAEDEIIGEFRQYTRALEKSNQLIFAFQRNIVKNKKLKPYAKWFEFAQKTRNENNQKEDFDIYTTDDIFSEMIRKLSHKSLDAEDLSFIEYYRLLEGQKSVWESQYKAEGEQTAWEKAQVKIQQAENKAQQAESKTQQAKSEAQQAKSEAQKAKSEATQAKSEAKQAQDKSILAMIQNTDFSDEAIANLLGVTVERVQQLRQA